MIKSKDFIEKHTIHFKYSSSALIMVIGSFAITLLVFMTNKEFVSAFFQFIKETPLLFFLNYIPVFLLMALILFISNNALFSTVSSGGFFILMAIANSEKVRLRQDPLFPTDLSLFTELVGIAKNFSLKIILLYLFIIVFILFIVTLAFVFFKSPKLSVPVRIAGISGIIIIGAISNNFLYKSVDLYNVFAVDGNQYFEVNQYGSKGFIYSFCHKFNSMHVKAPDGYNSTYYSALEKDFNSSASEYADKKLPHIIMVMGEAFSDLSNNPNFDFSNYGNPLGNWNEIAQTKNSVSGHIIVPNYGGGTSDTEFDVLTAYPTRYIDNASNSYSLIRKDIDSMPKRLRSIGYNTLAIHPGYPWFYNRANVYSYMGFESFISLESFQGSEKYRGGYIADKYASDSIIENFEQHIAISDSPLFEFCVTIENHGPYDEKYNEVEKTFDTDVSLTKNEETLLNSYFMGIKDADKEIKRLTDYFEASDEPVVFMYFGDHLPGFSNGMDFFDILDYDIDANGTMEELFNVYKTPFMIWQNSASKELVDISKTVDTLNLPKNHTISSNYLGSTMLELIGVNGISPIFDYSNELRAELPIITNSGFMTASGDYITQVNDELTEKCAVLKGWVHYKIFDE
ncbi:MAG: LTA synthase family protein [Lachnospiraceae bacterium]|nr:LTA synthase family protein [Lachnospiraceae bacterium]